MWSSGLIRFALASILLGVVRAAVKTEVGAIDYGRITMFPNVNLDGLLSENFAGIMQDKNDDFLVSLSGTMIIKFTPGSNVASLVAGLGSSTSNGVQATSTLLTNVISLAGDTVGNVYYSDLGAHCIRRIGLDGVVNTFAGICGTSGTATDGVAATSSNLNTPRNIFYHTQTNNLYIADTTNHRVRMVSISTNIITTVMGTSQGNSINVVATLALISSPYDVWVDSNAAMYVCDYGNNRIVRAASPSAIVSRFAGSGSSGTGTYPTGITATSALIGAALALTGDTSGNIYFLGATGSTVYRCNTSNTVLSFGRGNGNGLIHNTVWPTSYTNGGNRILLSKDGNLVISTSENAGGYVIQFPRTFNATSIVSTIAGYSSSTKSVLATSMRFRTMNAVWSDTNGALYIVDDFSSIIVKSSSGVVTHVAGIRVPRSLAATSTAIAATASISMSTSNIVGDTAGNLYYSHFTGVSKISTTGILSVAAGTASSTNCAASWNYAGVATSVNLCQTRGLALSTTGVLYLSDDAYVIRKLELSSGILSTIAGSGVKAASTSPVGYVATLYSLWLEAPRSLLFAADERHVVRRINLADGNPNSTVSVYAGQAGVTGTSNPSNNVPATSSALNAPRGICGSSNGDVYITQANQYYIRVVYAATQIVQNYVGNGTSGEGFENTAPLSTQLTSSQGCFVDDTRDTLYYVQSSGSTGSMRSSTPLAVAAPPSCAPTASPTRSPTAMPTTSPSVNPSVLPTLVPTVLPTDTPTLDPSNYPTVTPSLTPSVLPTEVPTDLPTVIPTVAPSSLPSMTPIDVPTVLPTIEPSPMPTVIPTLSPSNTPRLVPTTLPSVLPTVLPSFLPTVVPTQAPSRSPSVTPTALPSVLPTILPSQSPTVIPTFAPSRCPTVTPSLMPSVLPTAIPSCLPTVTPTLAPSSCPTVTPTLLPTVLPTVSPSCPPTVVPTLAPSSCPTVTPSLMPSVLPTISPSCLPTVFPTLAPSSCPTVTPSLQPTVTPTVAPSSSPSETPSALPSVLPTVAPSQLPTAIPTVSPSSAPSISPSDTPSAIPSQMPSAAPTVSPSVLPSVTPTVSPSCLPTVLPTMSPSVKPSVAPSQVPSVPPTLSPSVSPTVAPTRRPTVAPSVSPSVSPSCSPSEEPSVSPTSQTSSTVKFDSTWAFKLKNNGKSAAAAAAGVSSSRLRIRDLVPYELSVVDQQAIVQTQAAFLETSSNNIVYVSAQEDDVAIIVYAKTVVTLHLVDYPELSNNETQLFHKAKGILTEAVQSGSFVAALVTKAAEMNSTSFSSAVVTVVVFSEPTVIPAPNYDDGREGLSVGQVAGLVVGSIMGTFLLMCGVYWVFVLISRRKKENDLNVASA